MTDLLPCPFCGGKGHIQRKKAIYYGMNAYGNKKLKIRAYVYCGRCKARGGVFSDVFITDEVGKLTAHDEKLLNIEVANRWNRREDV